MVVSESPVVKVASLGEAKGYDLIGDIHGCAMTLVRLLELMGYKKVRGVYRHRSRQAIFLGDIVDRGPRVREALHLVRNMVEQGSALIVLGNHEFNAMTYCTPVAPGVNDYLRKHTPSASRQIAETLQQFSAYPHEWRGFLDWFASLPLFLEIEHPLTHQVFRAVHACWDASLIHNHRARYGDGRIDWEFVRRSCDKGSVEYRTRARLTGGIDLPLPDGVEIVSSDGYVRHAFRTKFWVPDATNYGQLLFQPDPLPEHIASMDIAPEHRSQMVYYDAQQPPLFVGHYWLTGSPKPIANNLACLDYSAVKYGRLVAYRMDGEAQLQRDKFVWVYVDP